MLYRRIDVLTFFTTLSLALTTAGCTLEPQGVGGDDPSTDDDGRADSTTSTSSGTDGMGMDDGSTSTGEGDSEGELGDVTHYWEDRFGFRLAALPSGDIAVMGLIEETEDSFVTFFSPDGQHEWGLVEYPASVSAFAALDSTWIALGGGHRHAEDASLSDAFFWVAESGVVTHDEILAEGTSFVTEIAPVLDGWWSLARQEPVLEEPAYAVVRRHSLEGTIELEYELPHVTGGLVVGADERIYTMGVGEMGMDLYIMQPDGGGYETSPLADGWLRSQLCGRTEPGVVLVLQLEEDEQRIVTLDSSGAIEHEFTATGRTTITAPIAHVTDTIVRAHVVDADTFVVEQHALDGTLDWTTEQTFVDAENILLADVIHHPDGAVVVGAAFGGPDAGRFVQFVRAS